MPDVLLAAVSGDFDTLHVTVDPAGLIDQLAELFADDTTKAGQFSTLVLAKEMLRKPRIDAPTRTHWEGRHAYALAALGEDVAVQQTLTAVLNAEQARDLTDLICDGLADLDGQTLYAMGYDDEPERELMGARAVEDRQ